MPSAPTPRALVDDGPATGDEPLDSFRRTVGIALVTLVVVCGALLGLNFFQGPELETATVDSAAVTTRPDQELRLFADQRVAEVDEAQVSVTPAADVTVSTADEVITVRFEDRLLYATDYTVTVESVTSLFVDQPTSFEHRFTTDPERMLYLDRSDPASTPDGLDAIVSTEVSGTDRSVEYEARRIQSFTVVGDLLAVVTLLDDGTNAITLVSRVDGAEERLVLPDAGIVDELEGSTESGRIAFVFSSTAQEGESDAAPEFSQVLYTVDLAGSHTPVAVPALDGSPLGVLGWVLEPAGSDGVARAIAQTFDETLLRVDLGGGSPPVPLGQYPALGRMSLDGEAVVVGDLYGSIELDLQTLEERRVPALAVDGELPFGGELQITGDDLERVQQVAIFDYDDGSFESYLVFDDGEQAGVLYQDPDGRGSLESFTVSPNGQFAAVSIIPDVAAGVTDGYLVDPQSTSVTTLVIDVATGAVVRSVDGFGVRW
ncbi:MAG: hypothetical protein RI885_1818 [Actinomycetota bacterium]